MSHALIGYTGFVGGNLIRQHGFQHLFNSKNIAEIQNQKFSLLVCSGARAEKWKANQNPEEDQKHIQSLMSSLESCQSDVGVLISTVDVYPVPQNVNENSALDPSVNHAYGKNRFMLEEFFKQKFKDSYILRLPGLFGQGLKKNIIFDFIHNNEVSKVDSRSVFQFYNLDNIWRDIEKARQHNLRLLNLAVEPVRVSEVAEVCGRPGYQNEVLEQSKLPRYDFKSIHSSHWGRSDGYLYSKEQVLKEIGAFYKTCFSQGVS